MNNMHNDLSESIIDELEKVLCLIETKILEASTNNFTSDLQMLEYQMVKIEGLVSDLKTALK